MYNDSRYFADAPNVVILISDGEPSEEIGLTLDETDIVKSTGAHVICVGISVEISVDIMAQIASSLDDVFILDDYFSLDFILDPIMSLACLKEGKLQETFHNFCTTVCIPQTPYHQK
jgi:hypothetical protein